MKFKVGDTVWAIKNSEWGTKPMKIVDIYKDSVMYRCKHPLYDIGAFGESELSLSPRRPVKMNKYLSLQKQITKLKKELFP